MFFFYGESDESVTSNSTDPYFYNVGLLLKMDNDFTDSSINNHTVTVAGNSSIDTTIKKYGDGAGYLDGSGDVLYVTGDSSLAIGTGDFTIETWAYFPILRDFMPLIDTNHYTNGILWRVMANGRTAMWFSNAAGPVMPAGSIKTNQWHHIALTRENGVARTFLDGVLIDTVTNTKSVTMGNIRIGQSAHQTSEYFKGYLDDYRITVGVARYTADFTPPDSMPTAGPSEIVSDNLTFHLDSSDINSYPGTGTTWTSLVNSSDVGTFVGDPTFNSAEANSIDLDGNGDYIQIDNTELFDFSGDFTLDLWLKLDQILQSNNATVIISNNILDNLQLSVPNTTNFNLAINSSGINYSTSQSVIGRWSNVVVSRISGIVRVYDNGVLLGSTTNATSIDSSQLFLGVQTPSRVPFYAHFTDGKIGSFRVYSDGLTSAEVLQNYNATKDRFGL